MKPMAAVLMMILVTQGCDSQPMSPSARPSTMTAASPSASDSRAVPTQMKTVALRHHYLAFTYVPRRLVFSGGPADELTSSPDVIEYDLASGQERVLTSAKDRSGTVISLSASDKWVVFVETYQSGPVIYRIRAFGEGRDLLLASSEYADAADQKRQRNKPIPMIATDGTFVTWTEAPGPAPGEPWKLRGYELSTGRRIDLVTTVEALSFPALSDGLLVFSEGDSHPKLLWMKPFQEQGVHPVGTLVDVSQAAIHGNLIAAKSGGHSLLDPGAIVLIERTTFTSTTIVADSKLAWAPSLNDRYVVWQGGSSIEAYDLQANKIVTLYDKTPAGRPAAFPGAVVWLSIRPEDVSHIGTAVPQFTVLWW